MSDVVVVANGSASERVVAGLSLLERAIRFAKAAGATRVFVVGETSARPSIEGVEIARLSDVATSTLSGRVHVLFATTVVDRRLAGELSSDTSTDAIVWRAADGPVGVFSASRDVLERATPGGALASRADFERALRSEGAIEAGPSEPRIAVDVTDDASAERAAEALWESCRKPVDGLVSRNLNRHISLFISRRIAHTAISPNHISILCLFLGFAAAAVALGGTYAHLVAGAAIFKLNSILDGVDGELARVKFAHSKLGELLDSAGDNVANFSFFGALSYVTWRDGDHVLAAIGAVGLSLWAMYLVFLYSRLYSLGRGDVLLVKTSLDDAKNETVAKVVNFFQTILRRDMFVMLTFVLAVLGAAKYMLPVVLGGASVTFGRAVVEVVSSLANRGRGAMPPA